MSSVEDAIKDFVQEVVENMDISTQVENAMPDVSKLVDETLDVIDWSNYITDPIKEEVRDQVRGMDWSDEIGDLIRDEIRDELNESNDIVTVDTLPKHVSEAMESYMATDEYKAKCEAVAVDRVDNLVTQPKFLTMLDMLASSRMIQVMNSAEFNKGLENRIVRKLAEVTETEEFKLRLDVANRKSLERVLSGLGRALFLR